MKFGLLLIGSTILPLSGVAVVSNSNNYMKDISYASAFLIVLLCIFQSAASANADAKSGHHELPHHHVALFAGAGLERDDHGHEEDGTALGIKYDIQFHEKWSIGVAIERLYGSGQHRSWVAVVPVSFHATEAWRIFAGPGFESNEVKDTYLIRVGLAYEFSINGRWSVSPEVMVDFIEGGAKTYVMGIALGYGF